MEQQEINNEDAHETTQEKQNHYVATFYGNLDRFGGSTNKEDYIPRGSILSSGQLSKYGILLKNNNIEPSNILKLDENRCMCGHYIVELCFIENVNRPGIWIQVGNCCVKRFQKTTKRVCEDCHIHFSSKKNIRCPDCRKKQSTK